MIRLRYGTLLCLGALLLPAQELQNYEGKVTEFTLANGLHFILLERRQVPVVSFSTYVNAGSAEDPAGQSGMAHLMERLAFSGSDTIGTRNWTAEKKALDDVDAAYERLAQERNKGARSDAGRIAAIQADASLARAAARGQRNPNEFLHAFQENGAVDVSCHATPDAIETSYSLPSNRIELWFLLESQRLSHPVFRNFYTERENTWNRTRRTNCGRPCWPPRLKPCPIAIRCSGGPAISSTCGAPTPKLSSIPTSCRPTWSSRLWGMWIRAMPGSSPNVISARFRPSRCHP